MWLFRFQSLPRQFLPSLRSGRHHKNASTCTVKVALPGTGSLVPLANRIQLRALGLSAPYRLALSLLGRPSDTNIASHIDRFPIPISDLLDFPETCHVPAMSCVVPGKI